jgi:hypothetical protein
MGTVPILRLRFAPSVNLGQSPTSAAICVHGIFVPFIHFMVHIWLGNMGQQALILLLPTLQC